MNLKNLEGMKIVKTFDIDGVVRLFGDQIGIRPCRRDFIVTGRSVDEEAETYEWLIDNGIYCRAYFNNVPYEEKTREKSGYHKAETIESFLKEGDNVLVVHYEDDIEQKRIIENYLDKRGYGQRYRVILVDHGGLIGYENERPQLGYGVSK